VTYLRRVIGATAQKFDVGRCRGKTEPFFKSQIFTSAKSITSPAAKIRVVGLQRPSRGQTCGGMLGTMAHIAPARPATRPAATFADGFYRSGPAVPEGRAALPYRHADHTI
jgi:hypothetical protein